MRFPTHIWSITVNGKEQTKTMFTRADARAFKRTLIADGANNVKVVSRRIQYHVPIVDTHS